MTGMPPAPPHSRCVLYVRVSTEEQIEGTSLDDQLEQCQAKAVALGCPVREAIADEGVTSALYEGRPGLQRALALIEAGEADTLICSKLDRLARIRLQQGLIIQRIQLAGARLVLCSHEIHDTPESRLQLGILGEFAEFERNLLRARTMAGRTKRARDGYQPSLFRTPYGYLIPTTAQIVRGEYPPELRGKYLVNPEQAEIVRRIFAEAAGGATLFEVVRGLNRDGVPAARGGTWHRSVMRGILRNAAYIGRATYGKKRSRFDEGRVGRKTPRSVTETYRRASYQVPAPPDEVITIPCPPLVEQEVWQAVQSQLDRNRHTQSGRKSRQHLLTGLLLCPDCGRRLTTLHSSRQAKNGKKYLYYYYRCPTYRHTVSAQDGATLCSKRAYGRGPVERGTLAALWQCLQDPKHIEAALSVPTLPDASNPDPARRQKLEVELARLAVREKAVIEAQIRGVIAGASTEPYERQLAEVAVRRRAMEAELKTFAQSREQDARRAQNVRTISQALEKLSRVLFSPDTPPADQRQVLLTLLEAVIPVPDPLHCPQAGGRANHRDTLVTLRFRS